MPLRFLVPAFLAGLLAIAVPIVIHLTRRRRAEVVRFPSLMFLEKVPYQAESRRRIQHWLLLLMRGLAVVLVAIAFARPFLDDAEAAAAGTEGPAERVLLIDRSYSMAVGDRWERAVEEARARIRALGPLDRASVVFFDAGAHVAARSTSDPARLAAAVDTARPGDRATRYGPGLKLARAILEESELPAREVVLIGDLQRAGWTGEEDVRLPPGTTVTPVPVGGAVPSNRAVADVQLARERFQGRERVTPTARLVRTGGEETVEVEVALELDGREIQRVPVELPASGSAAVSFDPFTLDERHVRGTVRIDPDALAGDDERHFVASPGRALEVLVLDDRRGASSLYLERALRVGGEGGFDVSLRPGGGVGPAELGDAAVVVVNDRPVPAASARALADFVETGGGLVVVAGERLSWAESIEGVLPGDPGPAADRPAGRGDRIGHVDYDHPVFEIFRGPRSGDFTGARFFRSRPVRTEASDSARVLARFDDGAPALLERRVGEGRVLLWASTLDAFWNDLALQPVFVPFVHRLVRHASGRSEALASFVAGQVIDVTDARAMERAGLGETADLLAAGEERVALTPSGGTRELGGGSGEEATRRFLELDERGFYLVRPPGRDDVRPLAVAVNVDLAEGDLGTLDPEEVAASLVQSPGEGEATAAGPSAPDLRAADRERRQSIWRFLLLGAFALLALETVLSNRASPRRAGAGGSAPR